MLLFASRCWFNHQCHVKSTVNCKKFSKSQKIPTERLLMFVIVHWTLLQQFQKCTSGMCILQRLTFEVFTWALVLQITVPHWQSHLWLASCETLLWLPALEEGTLVYIWPPRLLSTTTPVAGRGGRAGPKFLLIKEIRGRDLGHHATPALGPLALLACYLLPQPLPTTPKPHPP